MLRRAVLGTLTGIAALVVGGGRSGHARDDGDRSVTFAAADALPAAERARHERYMGLALDLLEDPPGGPFAAVVVDRRSGEVVCRGAGQHRENPILHGEIVALNACARVTPRVEWRELALYTTAEPCPMCMSAIVWTRIPEVIYGTSVDELVRLGANQFRLDSVTVAAAAPFYSGRIIGGILRARTDPIYQRWASRFR